MAALNKNRETPARSGDRREPPVAAATLIHLGSMVAINAGFAVPMSTAAGLVCVGRAESRVDNSDGAAGDLTVPVGAGTYRFENSAGADEITAADIGADCFGVDDQTVAKTDGAATRSRAGTVFDVDDRGVWVKFS